MWRLLRKTLSRGRLGIPKIRFRTRLFRRASFSTLSFVTIINLFSGLPFLLAEHFSSVADAFLLIDIRRLDGPKIRRSLPYRALVDPLHSDNRLLVDLGFDAR